MPCSPTFGLRTAPLPSGENWDALLSAPERANAASRRHRAFKEHCFQALSAEAGGGVRTPDLIRVMSALLDPTIALTHHARHVQAGR